MKTKLASVLTNCALLLIIIAVASGVSQGGSLRYADAIDKDSSIHSPDVDVVDNQVIGAKEVADSGLIFLSRQVIARANSYAIIDPHETTTAGLEEIRSSSISIEGRTIEIDSGVPRTVAVGNYDGISTLIVDAASIQAIETSQSPRSLIL